MKALVVSMRDYGSAAQKYFNYETDKLVAPPGTLSSPSDLSAYAAKKTVNSTSDGITLGSASLYLESETSIVIKFNVASGHTMGEYTFSVRDSKGNDAKYVVNSAENSIQICNIAAADFDQMYTVTVKKGSKVICTLQYGAFTYVKNKLESSSASAEIKDLCKAIYAYNKATKAYAGL